MNAFDRFRNDTRMILAMVRNGWATRMQAQRKAGREGLAMTTLQLFHHVRRTKAMIAHTRAKIPPGADHDMFRELLDYFETIEEGRDAVALADLDRMGYDPASCRETRPLPTTYNLSASIFRAVDDFGPYSFLGATYACEVILDDIRLRFHEMYAEDPDLCACIAFYRVFGTSGVDRGERAEACFKKYLAEQPAVYEPMLTGYLGAARNLLLLGLEMQNSKAYPREFELPPSRTWVSASTGAAPAPTDESA